MTAAPSKAPKQDLKNVKFPTRPRSGCPATAPSHHRARRSFRSSGSSSGCYGGGGARSPGGFRGHVFFTSSCAISPKVKSQLAAPQLLLLHVFCESPSGSPTGTAQVCTSGRRENAARSPRRPAAGSGHLRSGSDRSWWSGRGVHIVPLNLQKMPSRPSCFVPVWRGSPGSPLGELGPATFPESPEDSESCLQRPNVQPLHQRLSKNSRHAEFYSTTGLSRLLGAIFFCYNTQISGTGFLSPLTRAGGCFLGLSR